MAWRVIMRVRLALVVALNDGGLSTRSLSVITMATVTIDDGDDGWQNSNRCRQRQGWRRAIISHGTDGRVDGDQDGVSMMAV